MRRCPRSLLGVNLSGTAGGPAAAPNTETSTGQENAPQE